MNGTVEKIQQDIRANSKRTKAYVLGFYEYFFDGISDGSIRHGNNAEYSAGTIQVWKTFGVYLQEYCKKDILFDEIIIYVSPKNHLYLGNWMVKRVRWSVGSVIRLKVQW